MSRGIHLKQLTNTDLDILGLPNEARSHGAQSLPGRPSLLAEADPALLRLVGEVRAELESTLQLLEEALGARDAEASAKRRD
jgi:hypothetical protein